MNNRVLKKNNFVWNVSCEYLSQIRNEQSVHNKTRGVGARYRTLADCFHILSHHVEHLIIGVVGTNHLDKAHKLNRVEEMKSNKIGGSARHIGHLCDL
jgi:hypothetical protein